MKYKIPEQIESDRMILRKPIDTDRQDLHHYYLMKFAWNTAGRALADWETWRQVATMIGHWEIRRYGPYVMMNKNSGKLLGLLDYGILWVGRNLKSNGG